MSVPRSDVSIRPYRPWQDEEMERVQECLGSLRESSVNDENLYRSILEHRVEMGIKTIVADTVEEGIVGTASYFIEPKMLRGGCFVVHIEDVAVLQSSRLTGIGSAMMEFIREAVQRDPLKPYKIILDCSDDNREFYESLGYRVHERCMRLDLI